MGRDTKLKERNKEMTEAENYEEKNKQHMETGSYRTS